MAISALDELGMICLVIRLSELPNITVGVIEAGNLVSGVPGIDIPGASTVLNVERYINKYIFDTAFVGTTLGNPAYDWSYFTVPQEGLENRQIFTPRCACISCVLWSVAHSI